MPAEKQAVGDEWADFLRESQVDAGSNKLGGSKNLSKLINRVPPQFS